MIILETPQTKNPAYTAGRPMSPISILVHSTGANNPWLKRWVDAPDVLGVNPNNNHWNKPNADKCMHAFIGKDINGDVVVAHTLPYTVASWGCGKGTKGSYNRDPVGHIQFEICEDNLTNADYYWRAFDVAADYCALLCEQFGFDPHTITSHYEAARLGYASNHADPGHWMAKHGDSMDAFRQRVASKMGVIRLRLGSRGENVRQLQLALMGLGYDVGKNTQADGKFGPATAAAVKKFQGDEGLPVTGIWTPDDQNALDNALADENGPPVNDDAPPVDKTGLLTELEGLNKRQAVIIAALKGVM